MLEGGGAIKERFERWDEMSKAAWITRQTKQAAQERELDNTFWEQ